VCWVTEECWVVVAAARGHGRLLGGVPGVWHDPRYTATPLHRYTATPLHRYTAGQGPVRAASRGATCSGADTTSAILRIGRFPFGAYTIHSGCWKRAGSHFLVRSAA